MAELWPAGSRVLVRYRADPDLLHERRVVRPIYGSKAIVLMPDFDTYSMDLSMPPLQQIERLELDPITGAVALPLNLP